MEYPFETITRILSATVVVADGALLALFLFLLYDKFVRPVQFVRGLLEEVGRRAFVIGFVVSIGATLLSFFYSDVVGYIPCVLCWYQRVFVFSQPILFMVGLIKKESGILYSVFWLSFVGALISLYHYFVQMVDVAFVPCPATGGISCARREFIEFGYVTIPMMALTYFVTMMVIVYAYRRYTKVLSS